MFCWCEWGISEVVFLGSMARSISQHFHFKATVIIFKEKQVKNMVRRIISLKTVMNATPSFRLEMRSSSKLSTLFCLLMWEAWWPNG